MKKLLYFICLLVALTTSYTLTTCHLANECNALGLLSNVGNGFALFAILRLYYLIWDKHSFNQNLFYMTTLTAIAYGTEFLQGVCIIKGSFDVLDILLYQLAFVVSVYHSFATNVENLFTI
jgi:hypothetical protein